jgi:hypothetical protein
MKRAVWATLALCALAQGCGPADTKSYDFTENGCDTLTHSFDSLGSYCAALESSSVNNGCAQNLRQAAYTRDCQGAFVPTN